jgi:hypothetical protein
MATLTGPAVPEWLKRRDGTLKPGLRETILFVMLAGQPQYKLELRPAKGQFTCEITQTINGKRLDDGTIYPDPDAAFAGGLEQLRRSLGW